MIGSLEADVLEHSLVPPVKLIDFGQAATTDARQVPPDTQNANIYQGHASNVKKAAEVGGMVIYPLYPGPMSLLTGLSALPEQAVMRLINGYTKTKPSNVPVDMADIPTHAVYLWGPAAGQFPWLDQTLRWLIGRMMSAQYKVSWRLFFVASRVSISRQFEAKKDRMKRTVLNSRNSSPQ